MRTNLKIIFLVLAMALVGTLMVVPHPLLGIIVILDLAALIITLTFDKNWSHLEFFLTLLSVACLFFVLLALSAPEAIGTMLLAIVLGLSLFAGVILLIFHGSEQEVAKAQERGNHTYSGLPKEKIEHPELKN